MGEKKKQGQNFAATRIWMKPDDEPLDSLDEIQSFAPLPEGILNFEVPKECDEEKIVGAILAQHSPHLFV